MTDGDGVQLLRVTPDDKNTDITSSFISSFVLSSDQAGKLGLGRHKSIISMYNNYQVLQMNKNNLILTFVGNDGNFIGHILSIDNELDEYLNEIKNAVIET